MQNSAALWTLVLCRNGNAKCCSSTHVGNTHVDDGRCKKGHGTMRMNSWMSLLANPFASVPRCLGVCAFSWPSQRLRGLRHRRTGIAYGALLVADTMDTNIGTVCVVSLMGDELCSQGALFC